jgi:hypothetical protein
VLLTPRYTASSFDALDDPILHFLLDPIYAATPLRDDLRESAVGGVLVDSGRTRPHGLTAVGKANTAHGVAAVWLVQSIRGGEDFLLGGRTILHDQSIIDLCAKRSVDINPYLVPNNPSFQGHTAA